METDKFFDTIFEQFSPTFKVEEEKSKKEVAKVKNFKLMNCYSCKKGTVYIKTNLYVCPICKGHGKLIIDVNTFEKYNFGDIKHLKSLEEDPNE